MMTCIERSLYMSTDNVKLYNLFHLMQEVETSIFSGNVVAHWNRKNCVDGPFRSSNSGTFATLTRDLYRKTC